MTHGIRSDTHTLHVGEPRGRRDTAARYALVPVTGGFDNPTDTLLTVPVPADVEPGHVEVQVVTAAGVETNRVTIEVLD